MVVLCYDHAHVDVGDVCTFVGCCLATRGVRGLLWAKGWVWLTESWPVGLLGNSQQKLLHYLNWDAFAHAAHASQLRNVWYLYMYVAVCEVLYMYMYMYR